MKDGFYKEYSEEDFEMEETLNDDDLYYSVEEGSLSDNFFDTLSDSPISEL